MGTSLAVAPVNMLPKALKKDCCLAMLNMEKAGKFKFDSPDDNNIFLGGPIDDSIYNIIKDCGWKVNMAYYMQ